MMDTRNMTTAEQERVPTLTLGWRLKMALGEMKRNEMADHLGVDPGTLSRWMADKGAPPKRVYIIQWALMTGVRLDWLESGRAPEGAPNGGGSMVNKRYPLTLATAS